MSTTQLSPTVQPQTLDDLNRLNSWVRSKSFRQSSTLRKWVYEHKHRALRLLCRSEPDRIQNRAISVMVRCRRCAGTGTWISDNGDYKEPCRTCRKTGAATLEFWESTIDGMFKWHTPRMQAWNLDLEWPAAGASPELDWTPNQTGHDLTLDVALIILMRVERAMAIGSKWVGGSDRGDYWQYDLSQYAISLDRDDSPACVLCGAMPPEGEPWTGHAFTVGRIELALKACEACRVGVNVWDRLRPRERWEHLLSPVVREWINTHPKRVEAKP